MEQQRKNTELELKETNKCLFQSKSLKISFKLTGLSMWCYCVILSLLTFNGSNLLMTAAEFSAIDTLSRLDLSEEGISNNLNYFRVNLNNETQLRGVRLPCQCAEGECGCCSGNILQNFNIIIRQHFCVNMTYEREDASLGVKMSFNDVVLVSSRVSGKNPPPICIPIPRVAHIKFCGRFTNVYFIGRNIHACVSLETEWNNRTVFSYSFDCLRLGVNGVAIIPPEAGGGLPHPPDQEIDQIEEYDELVENQTTKKPIKKKTTKIFLLNSTIKRTTKKP